MLDLAGKTLVLGSVLAAAAAVHAQTAAPAAITLVDVSDTYKSGDVSMAYSVQVPKGAKPEHADPFHNYMLMLDSANAIHVAIVAGPPGNVELAIKQQVDLEKYTSALVERKELGDGATLLVMKAAPAIQTVHRFDKLSSERHVRVDCSGPPRYLETLKQMCTSFRKTK